MASKFSRKVSSESVASKMKQVALSVFLCMMFAHPAWTMSSLEKMELAFVGNPSIQDIKPILDSVMRDHSLAISEENYSRAGSALVAMRKEFGVSEIKILNCMHAAKMGSSSNVSFPDGVAVCAVTLAK